jgi:lipopolysaccharide transport system permease protein
MEFHYLCITSISEIKIIFRMQEPIPLNDDEYWDEIITSKNRLFDLRLKELWDHRDLIFLFVRRDFISVYKQTILGPLWYLIQPLFTTVIFVIVFGNIAKISTDGNPQILFYMSGLIFWNYFADCLNKTSNTFLNNAHIFGKVYFPRLSVPISIIITNLITFSIQFGLLLIFYFYYFTNHARLQPNPYLLLLPVLIISTGLLGLGTGIIISSLTTKYRDLKFLLTFALQLMMYATPVIYPLSTIPAKYQIFLLINPMTAIIETFRYALLGSGSINLLNLGYSILFTILALFLGIIIFNRVEKNFMDTI